MKVSLMTSEGLENRVGGPGPTFAISRRSQSAEEKKQLNYLGESGVLSCATKRIKEKGAAAEKGLEMD